MATITSKTAAAIDAIKNSLIKAAGLNASGHLVLTKNDDTTIDAGAITAPTGTIFMFAGAAVPAGWLLCNGAAVSRATYSALYAVTGDAFGAGDGSTTFNIPNMESRMPRQYSATLGATGGSSSHVHAGPSHTHTGPSHDHALEGGSVAAHARVTLTSGAGMDIDRISAASWDANWQGSGLSPAASTASRGAGSKVIGTSNTGGTGATGAGGTGNTAAPTGNTGWPPYLNLNFIIKT